MKNIVFLSMLVFHLGGILQAQDSDYVPMLGKDFTGWYEYIYRSNGKNGLFTLRIYSDGDTVIYDKTYIRLQVDRFYFETNKTEREATEFVREDTSQRKFYIYVNKQTEYVLYDFSLKPGDMFYFGDWTGPRYLRSIDHTVTTCIGTVRIKNRVFHFTDHNREHPITWVEGVGAISGLFWYFIEQDCDPYSDFREMVICKVRDNYLDYDQDGFKVNCPFELILTNKPKAEEPKLQIFPNPTTSSIRISSYPIELGKAGYRIFNVTGQIIQTGILDRKPETILDVSAFREGFYVIEIFHETNKRLTSQKFVVTK